MSKVLKRKRNVGRPTKYRKAYCKMLVEHMSKGLAIESFAGVIGVGFKTVYEWRHEHPEFQQAWVEGTAKSFEMWEKIGMKGMLKPGSVQSSIWTYNMRCRFRATEFQPPVQSSDNGASSAGDDFDV